MARNQPFPVTFSQYVALRGLSGFIHCFDVNQNLKTAAFFGSVFHRFSRRHRERAIANIARSFPEWPADRVKEVAARSFEHSFQVFMIDVLTTPRLITPTSWPKYVRLGRLEGVLERLIRHEPTIFITGHCGNWELLGYSLAVLGYPLYALARPLDNPWLNDWVLGIREARGMRIITKWGATPILQEVLRTGGRVAFIADQNAGPQGLFVPFFGRLASSYKSIGLLAMRYEVPIVCGCATRLKGRFEYELGATDIIYPDDWVDQPDPLFYITARYNRAMETMIRNAPEQYLWVHRRWKSRPRHERLGRPMPRHMVARLESLPWLTQQDLDRVIEQSRADAADCAASDR